MSSRFFSQALLQRTVAPLSPAQFWLALDIGIASFIETYIAAGHECTPPPYDLYAPVGASHESSPPRDAYVCPECRQLWLKAHETL